MRDSFELAFERNARVWALDRRRAPNDVVGAVRHRGVPFDEADADDALGVDARRLRQLFDNLLSNAGKFTPEKGRVLAMAKAGRDGSVTIAIADTGIGMTHEQIVVAMKPFAQVEGHLARSQEGAGLGLPLALGIARLHGGSLYLDSQPGAGTTAIVTLPRSAAVASPAKTGKAA